MSIKVEKIPKTFIPFKNHYKQKQEKKKEEVKKKIESSSLETPTDTEKSRFLGWA